MDNCKHERLRTVGDRVFCVACGKELDIAFLEAKNRPGNPPADAGMKKSPARKKKGGNA